MTDPVNQRASGQGPDEIETLAELHAEVERLRSELEAAQAQSAAQRDQALRAVAEQENIRKRAARDVEQAHRFALEKFAQDLLAVRDSLELAVASAGTADAASLAAGQEATLQLLAKSFERFSVRRVDPRDEAFDPSLHEAMAVRDAPGVAPGTVVEVVQAGYELNGRLLRPARVIVARGAENS